MKLDKRKLDSLSPEEANKLLEKLAKEGFEKGSVKISSASADILAEEAFSSIEQLDAILQSKKEGE